MNKETKITKIMIMSTLLLLLPKLIFSSPPTSTLCGFMTVHTNTRSGHSVEISISVSNPGMGGPQIERRRYYGIQGNPGENPEVSEYAYLLSLNSQEVLLKGWQDTVYHWWYTSCELYTGPNPGQIVPKSAWP